MTHIAHESGVVETTLRSPATQVAGLAWSSDRSVLGVVFGNGPIEVWDLATQRLRWTGQAPGGRACGVSFSPIDQMLALASLGEPAVTIWDASSGERLQGLQGHTQDVLGVRFTDDGSGSSGIVDVAGVQQRNFDVAEWIGSENLADMSRF